MTKRQNSKAGGRSRETRSDPVRWGFMARQNISFQRPTDRQRQVSGFFADILGIGLLFCRFVDRHLAFISGWFVVRCLVLGSLWRLGIRSNVSVTDSFSRLAIVDLVSPL